MLQPFLGHNHTDASNIRLRDCVIKTEELLDYAVDELGLPGLAITDHESLSNHAKAQAYITENQEKFKDFTLALGNEIYLVDRDEIDYARENNEKTKFPHFILIAKNNNGYLGLKEMSTKAWKNMFMFRGMERVPLYYDEIEEFMKKYKGDIIATTACVGGDLPQKLIKYHDDKTTENKKDVHNFITWLIDVFGKDDLYFELQPSHSREQLVTNEMMLNVSNVYGITPIVTTDSHYLNKEKANVHKIYLQASQGEREVDEFYATTYMMGSEEIHSYMDDYIGNDVVDNLIKNTHSIMNKIENIDLFMEVQVPKAHIEDYTPLDLTKEYDDKYEYIAKFRNSSSDMNRYYLYLIEKGLEFYKQELNDENLKRIDIELEQIWEVSEKLKQDLSSYFVLTKEVVDLMWQTSLVGVARGSAACYYTNYLLGIVQINPLEYDLPYWRFLSKDRPSLPDIDLDTESSQRENVITIVKDNFDYDKVINMGTFTTEGPRSTVITACRGLGVDVDVSHNISNLIPTEKTGIWSVRDTLYGNSEKGRKPVKQFKELVDRYDGLEETMVNIEGIVSGRSQHASGTIVYPNTYTNYNAMMKTKKGLEVTQFDADDTEAMGGLKLDFLSISGLARVRKCMDLLLEDGLIEWQGNLRETYNKYFHPDKLDMTSKGMYDMLLNGDVFDAFQMSSPVGVSSINKIKPETFDELAAANSLMRLTTEGEQPIDKYVRYKQDLSEWYNKMSEYGLNEEEVNKMKKHLDSRYGICDTQELIMSILVDENIANASMVYANKFRKIIAGKQRHKLKQGKEDFYKMMEDNGQREKFADYIWYECFSLQFGYSFSLPHIAAYSMILMIEMNMAYHYPTQYWKTACLSINSGLEGDLEKGTDYGTVSQAVNSMSDSIELPDINKSSMEFIPTEDEKIMFGLKPIAGLGTDAIEKVINNRPYNSVSDFYDKNIENKEMPISKAIVLVKAGAFHNINNTAREAAIELTNCHVKKRDKLTTVQLPKIIKLARQQKPELNNLFNMFEFRQSIKGKTAVPMNKKIERFFMKHYANDVEYTFDDNGVLDINIKSFEKMFNKESKPLKEWLKSDEAIELLAKVEKQQFWIENFSGTPESWEMETIMFYSDKHEIDYIDLLNNFNLVDFNDMEQEKVKNTYKTKKGITKTVFETENIAGTVVEKNKAKSLVYVLTKYGVVTVRVPKYKFSYYDKKIVDHDNKGNKFILDDSWFDRGTILLLSGYRRGEEFVMYKPGRDSSDIYKIIKNDTQYNLIETKPKEK